LCLACTPVGGGTPWQLAQGNAADADQTPVPWHEFAHVCVAPFQPMPARISLIPLR
jgi:hypothetical protein